MDSLKRLDKAVGRLIAALDKERARAKEASGRVKELEKLLKRFEKKGVDPAALSGTVDTLRKENKVLRSKMNKGRESAERLLARVRFLEEKQ